MTSTKTYRADPPALLLLSGLLCDGEIWQDVARRLEREADVRILSFAGFDSIGAMAEHVLASAPGRCALAGHSMGGRVALEAIRRAPARFSGLALLNTGIHGVGAGEHGERGRLVALAREQGMQALAAEWLPPMLGRPEATDAALVYRLSDMVARSTPDSFAGQVAALLSRPDADSVLPGVRPPVLLLSADGDRWSPPAQHARMREQCLGAELVVASGCGHFALVESPDAVTAALREWLERIQEVEVAGVLDDGERRRAEAGCRDLVLRYARLSDAGAWDAVADLFVAEGELIRPSVPNEPLRGRERIRESFKGRPQRLARHAVSDVEVRVESATRAHAASTVTLHVAAEAAGGATPAITSMLVGRFHDTLVRRADEWRFLRRHGSVEMRWVQPAAQ